MDLWMLLITILAFLAALAAAIFAWPTFHAWLKRPDLRLEIEPLGGSMFHLRLKNDGQGSAVGWRLTVESPYRFIPDELGRETPIQVSREADSGWILMWYATGADDTIEPHLHREARVILGRLADESANGGYTLIASRMKQRTGIIRRSLGELGAAILEID